MHRPPTRTQTSLSETATQNGGSDLTRARVDLLSSITQEFRVPLGLILGPLEELVAAPASRWTAHERAQIAAVHRNSFRLFRLVNTLLDLSRLDDVGGTAEDGVVDVSGLTLSITNSFRAIFEQGGVELAVECDALPPMRSVSSDTWEKIVLNLLSNAFKFTRQGRIEVALRGRETQIELSVRDTGAGIPVAEIPHLFHPFHRYKEPLARNQDGVGLGLARVGELVRLCRGTIRVDSEYGRGSTFVVSVPADPADLEAAGVPTPRAALATTLKISSYVEEARSWLTNRTENSPRSSQYPPGPEPNPLPLQALPSRILVVVENADVRDYLLRLLSGRYAVEAAANGEAAFSAMGERRPDLIIASTPHSGQGGLELLARVRAREGSRLTPFILLSQNPTSAARVAGLSAGADDYLVQPFSARELLARVAAHLEMARLRNEAARSDAEHAVERQRLYEAERIARKAAQRAADRTARLQALTAAFSRASTPEAVAEVVTLQGVAAIGATSGTVYLLGEDTSSLERLGAPGATSDSSDLPADSDAAAALAVRTRAPQFPDLAQGRYAGTPLESIAAVPLLVGDKIIGAIAFRCLPPHLPGPDDRGFILTLAEQCAQALDRARLYAAERAARAEADIERERFHAAFMQAPVPMIVFEGPRHVIRLVNPLWAASHDVVGRLLAEASPAAVEQGLVAMLDLVYRTGGPLKLTEHPFRFDDGAGTEEERFFDTSFQPTRDAAGNVTGIIAVGTEVTEQVLARRRIEEARVLLDTLLMNAPIGISVLDSNLRFIQVNEALARITGIPVHGHLGQTVSEIWGEDFGGAVEERLSQVLASGVPITDCEMSFPVRREAWDTQCFLTSYYPICIQGEITGVGALVQDITERRHAEAERARLLVREQAARTDAELANRLKDEFLARVSHELRTPLAAMKLWIHVLEAGRADDAPRAIEAVSEGVKAQSRMIEDLLDVARGMSGKLRLNLQPTELGKVVRAAVAAVRPEAAQRSILLSLRTENGPARIMADEARVNQIVSNLLSNALKFTPEGGSVAVVLTSDEGHARIRVSDSGQGITPDFLPHLFTPFRQGDGSNTRSHGGLGLGLSIVRQLVELHGGTVTAESPGEAKGATFTVSLPRTAMSVAASPSVTPPDSQWLRGLDVLLIEDDHPTRQGLALVLEKYGVHVRQAASAREAIEAYQTAPPSVILCDLSMPVEDGYSFIRKVRTLEGQGARRIPAAALTAHARAKDRLRALSAGFQAHIAKPVEVAELLAAVAKLSGRARAS